MANERTAVYRCYGASDELLYVGASGQLAVRLRAHERTRPEWHRVKRVEAIWYDTRAEALAAESEAISTELPAWNHRDIPGWHPTPGPRVPGERWLTTGQVGDLIGRDSHHVIRLIKSRRLPATTLPGSTHRRILRSVAEAYRDKMEREAGGGE